MVFPKSLAARSRRGFLRSLAGLAAWAVAWRPLHGAAKPPKPAESDAYGKALALALNGQGWNESDQIGLEVPELAENGAIVPITVESRLPNTGGIWIFAEKNPGPLLARFDFQPGTEGWVSLRVKLNESGPVLVIAESEGKFYGASRRVKVMVGGCG